jgi:hypothetical protein
MTAQEAYNNRMKARKSKAKALRTLMNGLSKSLKTLKEEGCVDKRIEWTGGLVKSHLGKESRFKPVFITKKPREYLYLNFER